jgi:hypothetical protein
MHHPRRRLALGFVFSLSALVAATQSAQANFYELLRRVPDSANTLIMVDVEKLLSSPIAMREKWRDTINSSRGEPLHIPANAKQYMLASKLNFVSNWEDLWNFGLIETPSEVSLPFLAKAEGGYLDTVANQQVAYSPRNAFLVALKPTILGVAFPANRQDLGRWLRSIERLDEPQVSEYLRGAVALASGQNLIVVALDVSELFTRSMMRDALRRAESLAGKELDLDALTTVLTSARGVTLSVRATDRLEGTIQVDFGASPAPLKEFAKALFFEVLEDQGMMLDEMKDWAILVEGKAITLKGRLSTKGLRTLTNLIPFPAETLDLPETDSKSKPGAIAPASAGSSSGADSKAATSRRYFQHISLLLDQLKTDVRNPNTTPKIARRTVDKAALEIDRLPVLNVDEEVIAYGSGVAETLRGMRNLSQKANLEAGARQSTILGSSGYGYGGFYGGTTGALETSVMRKQMNAMLKSNQLDIVTLLEEKTAEIRKKMTLKYQIEF